MRDACNMWEKQTRPPQSRRENKALRSHLKKSEPSSTSLSHSTIQSGNRLSTTFKIYPEGDHFSAPPLLPPSFPTGVRRPPGWPPYSTPTPVYSPRSTWRDPPTLTSHHVLHPSTALTSLCSGHPSVTASPWTSRAYFSLKAFTLAVPLPRIPFAHIFTWLTLSPLLRAGPNELDHST